MKKFKNLFTVIAIGLMLSSSYATTISTNITANINQIIPGPARINRIQATSPVNNTATIVFYDAPYTNLTFTTAAYSTVNLTGPSTYVEVYTNVFNVVERWTNTVVRSTSVTTAAATNTYPIIFQMVIPTNTTATFTPTTRLFTGYGLTVTNNQAVNVFVDYTQ